MALQPSPILVARGAEDIFLYPKMANRHGLIAGATGTGKTVTLRVLAEQFSNLGVPVFMADVKGDLSGLAKPGGDNPRIADRVRDLKLEGFAYRAIRLCSGTFSAKRGTRSGRRSPRWGRCFFPASST